MARVVLVLVAVISIGRLVVGLPAGVPLVASHFDATGRPDGFLSPATFVAVQVGVLGLLVASAFALPALLRRVPANLVNLPNKAYWLAPERREATARTVGDWFGWMNVATALVAALACELALRANVHPDRQLAAGVLWAGLGAYVAFAMGWMVAFWRRFRVPEGGVAPATR